MSNSTGKFPRARRLTRRREFLAVYRRGRRYRARGFNLYLLPNGRAQGRLGLTVHRRVGRAVARNRLKRAWREYFRQHPELFAGWDVVVDVRLPLPEGRVAGEAQIDREVSNALATVPPRG